MTKFAILLGSAPEDFRQKKIEDMFDFLDSKCNAGDSIVTFANGISEMMLEMVMDNSFKQKPNQIFLYNFVGQIDILMTDYSSIYFDFIATKKPVILAPFDLEEYIVTSRAHYFDYSELEGAKAKNWQEFYKILEENSYVPVLEETRKKFSEYVDGNACERLWKEITK